MFLSKFLEMSDMKRSRRDFVLLTAKKWLVRADHFRDSQLALAKSTIHLRGI